MAKHRYNTVETRRELIASGRRLFSDVGYAAARTEEIVAMTGLTRGALYHHFGDKQGLFRAVLEDVQVEVSAEVDRRARAKRGGVEGLRAACHAYLDLALHNDVRRILLVDGPAVLGWDEWHEIDLRHTFGVTKDALEQLMRAGEIEVIPADALTHVLLGIVTQAGLVLGRSSTPKAARREFGKVVDLLIDKLVVTAPNAATPRL